MTERPFLAAAAVLLAATIATAAALPTPQEITWTSVATGTALKGWVYTPPDAPATPLATVVYQKNLSIPRLGKDADEAIIADLLESKTLVLVLDYAKHEQAKSPELNADSLALRQAMTGKTPTLLADRKVDGNHIFLLAEGYRLRRDVWYASESVADDWFLTRTGRQMAMDIAYPTVGRVVMDGRVPLLIEFSCDNAERMGSGSLVFCRDTLLDGAMYRGYAVAMADHPVKPPYKGLDDPMPQAYSDAVAAVAEGRAAGTFIGFGKRVGVIGFSRGGPFAAMTAMNSAFANADVDWRARHDVNAALVHGNRYDYLDLLPADPMLPRFKKAWGDPTTQPDEWSKHSALHYLSDPKRVAPMFLNTSRKESAEYQDGLAKLHNRLTQLGVDHVYQVDDDDRGHRVTTDPATLTKIYDFFDQYLKGTEP